VSCKSIIAFMAALLMSASAWAGLGQVNLYSQMGQPFRASVALDGLASVSAGQVRAGLANQAAFDEQNVDYEPVLASLHFAVQPGAGGPVVQITSSLPIRSSYLSFVLEVDSPAGRWLRAYTVMLDVAQAAAPKPAVAAAPSRPQTVLAAPAQAPVVASRAQTPPPAAQPVAPDASSSSSAEVQALRQQVNQSSSALAAANKHIADLQNKIKALQALQPQSGFQLGIGGFSLSALSGILHGIPAVVVLAAGLLLILVFLSWWLLRRRARARALQSGAKAVPHGHVAVGGATATSNSAAGGDPIAEADVYLAYGHNEQAQEVLRKGLEREPTRQDIRYKLMELYAAVPDRVRFEHLAREVHEAYDGRGAMWERARALGQTCDPTNPFYLSDDDLNQAMSAPPVMVAGERQAARDSADELASLLDFSEDPKPGTSAAPPEVAADNVMLNFDFSLEDPVASAPSADAASEAAGVLPTSDIDLDFAAPDLSGAPIVASPASEETAIMIDPVEVVDNLLAHDDENLSTKLDLARVYLDMGDGEGAREVLQELLQEAKGPLRQQANDMLEKLNN